MRPKFVLMLALVTTLILVGVYFLHQRPQPIKAQASAEAASPPPAKPASISQPQVTMAVLPEPPPSPEEKQAAIVRQMQQVQTWAQADDPSGLENIMSELATNSETQVRLACIAAAKQSGNREIIPTLKETADRTEDLKEKQALLDAAEFLAGPTVSEQSANLQPIASSSP